MRELVFANASGCAAEVLLGTPDPLRCRRELQEVSSWLLGEAFNPTRTVDMPIPHSDPTRVAKDPRNMANKHAVVARLGLKTLMPDMLLPDMAPLAPNGSEYHDNAGKPYFENALTVGRGTVLKAVHITVGGAIGQKTRFCDPDTATRLEQGGDVIASEGPTPETRRVVWPAVHEWNGGVGVVLWHAAGELLAGERVSLVTCHTEASEFPAIQTDVLMPHCNTFIPFPYKVRPARDESEADGLLRVVRDLHAVWASARE